MRADALYLKSSERQNSTHLTLLKHQNTNTSLYKLSKNCWVIALCDFVWSVTNKLQSIVSFDHPISTISKRFCFFGMRRLPLKVTQLINLVNCFRNESWFRKYPYNSLCFLASRKFEAQFKDETHVPWQQPSTEHSAAAGAAGTLTC